MMLLGRLLIHRYQPPQSCAKDCGAKRCVNQSLGSPVKLTTPLACVINKTCIWRHKKLFVYFEWWLTTDITQKASKCNKQSPPIAVLQTSAWRPNPTPGPNLWIKHSYYFPQSMESPQETEKVMSSNHQSDRVMEPKKLPLSHSTEPSGEDLTLGHLDGWKLYLLSLRLDLLPNDSSALTYTTACLWSCSSSISKCR